MSLIEQDAAPQSHPILACDTKIKPSLVVKLRDLHQRWEPPPPTHTLTQTHTGKKKSSTMRVFPVKSHPTRGCFLLLLSHKAVALQRSKSRGCYKWHMRTVISNKLFLQLSKRRTSFALLKWVSSCCLSLRPVLVDRRVPGAETEGRMGRALLAGLDWQIRRFCGRHVSKCGAVRFRHHITQG